MFSVICLYIPSMTPNIRLETIKNTFKIMGDVIFVYFKYDTKRRNSKDAFIYITLYENTIDDFEQLINSKYGFQMKPYGNDNPYIVWEVFNVKNTPIYCL